MHHRSPIQPPRAVVLILMLSLALATVATSAGAQTSVQLNMAVGDGSRNMSVTTVSGGPLTELTLQPGQAQAYRVVMTDVDYLVDQGFEVQTANNRLYRVTNATGPVVDFDTFIPSANVALSHPSGLLTSGLQVDLTPEFLLSLVDGLDCLTTLNALTELSAADLLLVPTICTTVQTLATTTNPLSGAGLAVPDATIPDLDLSSLPLDQLPTALTTGQAGGYTNPSADGIAAGDGDVVAANATRLNVMKGTPLTALPQALLDLINAQLPDAATSAVSDILSTDQVLSALLAEGDATMTTLSDLIGSLSSTAAKNAVVNAIFDLADGVPALTWLSDLVGVYTALPALTATPEPTTPDGSYTGTHTITLVSQ